ncbi:Transmembrane emp24 domain-containing protein p24delta3 [Apostasia shenzhenica]|uniref:Transmembrane emp24 domain-containing protein p24delta3 n=1 Tax=Apostasia shenzhenica TaxID=1088818 RepID=A0A2I0A0S3_9ASPA|nr:Transmembrane emp24 domain-containing protein p24delta3 [Apostasia shenzhenica]
MAAISPAKGMEIWRPWILLLVAVIPGGGAIWLSMPPAGTKCVSEGIQTDVVVLGEYAVVYEDEERSSTATVSVKVTSPHGNTLHHQENVTVGKFAFTTSEAGNYLACFWLDGANREPGASISLDWKTGIAAKDWHAVAKKKNIEGVELELIKLEGAVDAIHENLLYLKEREAEMSEISEKTNARVSRFSILSLGVCILVSALQAWYLKGFFQKKKII